ncbi:two-component system sensor kinase [Alloactinosynnema sp. L-07]|uniref:sensor histidine kinase n=1 Tax=Alloactinosynnema sp. L-07 TaxID=1653480 RepID=UPI00065F039F|nr:histidine kinase [Alloactinosynnema sp. L-07]CRK56373.1 two-component system sensor kinase [Alloactinosynnema sp. L-07]
MISIAWRVVGPVGRMSTYRVWVYLILGGALLVPFGLFSSAVVSAVSPVTTTQEGVWLKTLAIMMVMVIAMTAMSLIPAVRVIEGTAARELLGDAVPDHGMGRVTSWPRRIRWAAWIAQHLITGGVIAAITFAMPFVLLFTIPVPFTGRLDIGGRPVLMPEGWASAWLPAVGLLSVLGLVHLVVYLGGLFCRAAPWLLGPTAADRLAAMTKQAERLAERNRLARDLHDSVGHALSVVTVQAAAARRVLESDLAFAERALGAIEDSARSALADLDHVLGLLREDGPPASTQWTLEDLPALLRSTQAAGVTIESSVDGNLGRLPNPVSREAYRIVQECLTNVVRHAGMVAVNVRLVVRRGELAIDIDNPLDPGRGREHGGRGVAGMRERVGLLHGRMSAGPKEGRWCVSVRIPAWSKGER